MSLHPKRLARLNRAEDACYAIAFCHYYNNVRKDSGRADRGPVTQADQNKMNDQFDYVATGNVKQGEWMRRYQAEAEEVEYRELTEAEAEEINEQLGV